VLLFMPRKRLPPSNKPSLNFWFDQSIQIWHEY
jgi:hypothetical protein